MLVELWPLLRFSDHKWPHKVALRRSWWGSVACDSSIGERSVRCALTRRMSVPVLGASWNKKCLESMVLWRYQRVSQLSSVLYHYYFKSAFGQAMQMAMQIELATRLTSEVGWLDCKKKVNTQSSICERVKTVHEKWVRRLQAVGWWICAPSASAIYIAHSKLGERKTS